MGAFTFTVHTGGVIGLRSKRCTDYSPHGHVAKAWYVVMRLILIVYE